MRLGENVIRIGAPGSGKTLATALSVLHSDGAEVISDPHKDSLAKEILTHAKGNILHAKLSDVTFTLGFDLLTPSTNLDPVQRSLENHRRAEAFVEILLRRRDFDSMASTPLMEEWCLAAIMLYLFQSVKKPLAWLPFAFLPGTEEFAALVKDCTLPEIRHKFAQLEKLNPRALRAEVGSASRLLNGVFRSPVFIAWCRGGFDLGAFLQNKGKLVVERGDEIGDDTMRVMMCAINLRVIEHAKRRKGYLPTIRIRLDEATNAGLAGKPEFRAAAETNKNGLYLEFNVQKLDFPGDADAVLQLCQRHEWYWCPQYDLARKGAIDLVTGMPQDGRSRAERIEELTNKLMNLKPGWRGVRDARGARIEYVPMLENPWPDWPGLHEARLAEKIRCIHERPEYRTEPKPSPNSSKPATPPPASSPDDSSPAKRLKRDGKRPPDGSPGNGSENGSA